MCAEVEKRWSHNHYSSTLLANSDLVHINNGTIGRPSSNDLEEERIAEAARNKKSSRTNSCEKFRLMVCMQSVISENEDFLNSQPIYSSVPGAQEPGNNIKYSLNVGLHTAVKGKLIQFHHMWKK